MLRYQLQQLLNSFSSLLFLLLFRRYYLMLIVILIKVITTSSCVSNGGKYLKIIPRARMGYDSIAHEAEGRMGY